MSEIEIFEKAHGIGLLIANLVLTREDAVKLADAVSFFTRYYIDSIAKQHNVMILENQPLGTLVAHLDWSSRN